MDNKTNTAARESLLTIKDINATVEAYKASTTDLLGQFPDLQKVVRESCVTLGLLLIAHGASTGLAEVVASSAYRLATLSTLSMHRAVWNAVLPDDAPQS